jgi:hypothetical protein
MKRRHHINLVIAFLLLAASIQAVAEKPERTGPPGQSNAVVDQSGSQGPELSRAEVTRDPTSGKIKVTPGRGIPVHALSLREQNMLNRSDEGLEATVLPSGAVAVNLRGRFQSMAAASAPSGKGSLEMICSIGDEPGDHSGEDPGHELSSPDEQVAEVR